MSTLDADHLDAWRDQRDRNIADKLARSSNIALERGRECCDILARRAALTPAGIAAKLRSALWTNTNDFRVEAAVLGTDPLDQMQSVFNEALSEDDYVNECIWMAIVSLEAMVDQTLRTAAEDRIVDRVHAEQRMRERRRLS